MVKHMTAPDKAVVRARLQAARLRVTAQVRAAENQLLCGHLKTLRDLANNTVCAYVPVGVEPGSIAMLDVLLQQARRVLLPVVCTTPDDVPLPLRWGQYRPAELVPGRWGLLEPAEPWLAPTALAEAGVILVPALAVDRRGARLGRGGGFYDRSLTHRDREARLIAVVRDDELVDELPSEPHDVGMTHALTPQRGMIRLVHER